jgi:hypothetical protein
VRDHGVPVASDTVGEFSPEAVRPEDGRFGADWKAESAIPDLPDEFANSISIGTESHAKRVVSSSHYQREGELIFTAVADGG